MVEKDTVLKEAISFSGISDFKGAYEYAFEWLKSEGFGITEEKYSEKVSGNAKDVEVKWKADKTLNDYFKITLDISWRIFGMTDVEAEIDGKKKKMNKFAGLEISVKGILEKDHKSQWSGKATHRFFKDLYYKYIIPSRIDENSGKVKDTVQNFKEEMKAYFDLTGKRSK